jgi:hypothetical protein
VDGAWAGTVEGAGKSSRNESWPMGARRTF